MTSLLFHLCCALLLVGCASNELVNPSFPITTAQAHAAIVEMEGDPKPLLRPVVVIGGFMDPHLGTVWPERFLAKSTNCATVIPVYVGFCGSFNECREKVIAAVEKVCPSSDPNWTSEVDVIGLSLGGLVARYAATDHLTDAANNSPGTVGAHAQRRLKICRLFTISSPHSGATIAQAISLSQFHRDVKPGSDFLTALAAQDTAAHYALFPYVLLGDDVVGQANAAPPGVVAWWLPSESMWTHFAAMTDERIFADIGRRLRGESPYATEPRAASPKG